MLLEKQVENNVSKYPLKRLNTMFRHYGIHDLALCILICLNVVTNKTFGLTRHPNFGRADDSTLTTGYDD